MSPLWESAWWQEPPTAFTISCWYYVFKQLRKIWGLPRGHISLVSSQCVTNLLKVCKKKRKCELFVSVKRLEPIKYASFVRRWQDRLHTITQMWWNVEVEVTNQIQKQVVTLATQREVCRNYIQLGKFHWRDPGMFWSPHQLIHICC